MVGHYVIGDHEPSKGFYDINCQRVQPVQLGMNSAVYGAQSVHYTPHAIDGRGPFENAPSREFYAATG